MKCRLERASGFVDKETAEKANAHLEDGYWYFEAESLEQLNELSGRSGFIFVPAYGLKGIPCIVIYDDYWE